MYNIDDLHSDFQKLRYSIPENLFRDIIIYNVKHSGNEPDNEKMDVQLSKIFEFFNGHNIICNEKRNYGSTTLIITILTYLVMKETDDTTVLVISNQNTLNEMKHRIINCIYAFNTSIDCPIVIGNNEISNSNIKILFREDNQIRNIIPDLVVLSNMEKYMNNAGQIIKMLKGAMKTKESKYGKFIIEYKPLKPEWSKVLSILD